MPEPNSGEAQLAWFGGRRGQFKQRSPANMEFLPQRKRRWSSIGTAGMYGQQRGQTRLHDGGEIGDPLIRQIAPPPACIAHHGWEVSHFGPHRLMRKTCEHRHYPCRIVQG